MGNCVACGNDKGKDKPKFGGMDGNKTAGARITKSGDIMIDKSTWILTNDGKFSEKYSMG